MFWCLVRLSTGTLSWGLYANPLEMAIQSVACSEAKDGGLMECVLVWFVSFSLAVENDLLIVDKSFDFSVWHVMGLLLFASFFCELICYFISPNASVCLYPLENNTGRLSEGADVLCELLLSNVRFTRHEGLQSWQRVCDEDCFLGLLFPRNDGFCGIQQC